MKRTGGPVVVVQSPAFKKRKVIPGGARGQANYARAKLILASNQMRPAMPPGYGRYTQSRQGGEIKSVDVINPSGGATQAPFTLNTTPQFTILNVITTGASAWNRIGRKVTLRSVYLQGYIFPTGVNSDVSQNWARIMIVYDKQPNGALPNIADLIYDQPNSATDQGVSNLTSGINMNNKDRFEIIRDIRLYLPGGNTNTAATGCVTATSDCCHIESYSKLAGRETHYKADSSPSVIGDIATGSLFMVAFSNAGVATAPWALEASVRLRFSDL